VYDADQLVKHTRKGNHNGFDTVADTYEFEPQFKNGQVRKVVAIYQPGRGYRTIVHIESKGPIGRPYHDGQWAMAKFDLGDTLLQHQCDLSTIKDPRQPRCGERCSPLSNQPPERLATLARRHPLRPAAAFAEMDDET
jgi:hypothetical protein